MPPAGATHLLVDGMNVVGSRPDGWWHDRDAAVRALVTRLRPHARDKPVTVVFDGRPPPGLPEGEHDGVTVRYAHRGGPNAADDRIVELLDADDRRWTVVTSDRDLAERARRRGADVVGARTLLSRLDEDA